MSPLPASQLIRLVPTSRGRGSLCATRRRVGWPSHSARNRLPSVASMPGSAVTAPVASGRLATSQGKRKLVAAKRSTVRSVARPQVEGSDVERDVGQDQRVERFFAALYPVVRTAAYARINDWQEAEDLAEEVFTAAWRRRAEADVVLTAEWASGARHNLVGNEYRRRARTRRREVQLAANPPTAAQPDRVEDGLLVRAMVARLAQPDRHLLQMAYWDDRTREQMADALDCSSSAVKTRLSRSPPAQPPPSNPARGRGCSPVPGCDHLPAQNHRPGSRRSSSSSTGTDLAAVGRPSRRRRSASAACLGSPRRACVPGLG